MSIFNRVKQLGDISRFSWKEMLNDNSGKTSASSTGGFVLTVVGAFIGIYSAIIKNQQVIQLASSFAMYGAALLGAHAVMNRAPIETVTETKEEVTATDNQ